MVVVTRGLDYASERLDIATMASMCAAGRYDVFSVKHNDDQCIAGAFVSFRNHVRLKFMNRFVKTWLLWLLMLAVPLQALASVGQLSCDVGHQRQSTGHTAKAGPAGHGKASLRLKRQTTAMAGKHGGKQAKKAAQVPMQEMDHTACGPCATCCGASTALPNLHSVSAPWDISRQFHAMLPTSHVGFIPEGLERPPRQLVS